MPYLFRCFESGSCSHEIDLASNFLETEPENLSEEIRENIYRYNRAILYYKTGALKQAMHELATVSFTDIFNNLTYRTLLLRIYYQLGELQALDYLLDSFMAYLYRQRKIGYHKTLYLNLIKIMRRMMRSDLNSPSVRQQLRDRIVKLERVAEKDWLLTQLE